MQRRRRPRRCPRARPARSNAATTRWQSFPRSRPRQEPFTLLGLKGNCRSLAETRQGARSDWDPDDWL